MQFWAGRRRQWGRRRRVRRRIRRCVCGFARRDLEWQTACRRPAAAAQQQKLRSSLRAVAGSGGGNARKGLVPGIF